MTLTPLQTLAIIATPLVVALMMILLNKRSEMGEYKATLRDNVMYWIVLIFSVVIAVVGIMGIFNM